LVRTGFFARATFPRVLLFGFADFGFADFGCADFFLPFFLVAICAV
jgi:hypothetical protein